MHDARAPVAPVDGDLDDQRWWDRNLRWWHALFGGMCVIVALTLLTGGAGWPAYALVVLIAAAYALLGTRALPTQDARLATVYLAVVVPALGVLVHLDRHGMVLLFGLYPQAFALYERLRHGVVAVVVITASWSLGLAARAHFAPTALPDIAVDAAANLAFSLLLGLFVTALLNEGDRRAALIRELRETQAELAASHHREGTLAERERLSREIHDTLAQGFTSVLMLARAATRTLASDSLATAERLRLIETAAAENLAEARSLVAALAPADLGHAGSLETALHRLVGRFGDELGLPVLLDVSGQPRALLSTRQEVVLLRVAQESLANVRKHAAASSVVVRLAYGAPSADAVMLEVGDDGRGFEGGPRAGYGLDGMRARVEQVSGRLAVESAAGAGTTVRVTLGPLPAASAPTGVPAPRHVLHRQRQDLG